MADQQPNGKDERFMRRCFELARRGRGRVSPNPLVGAVLEHEGRILSEGYHQAYGQAHAEVRAVAALPEERQHLLREATLYVSLEPCCYYGKTPPCTQLILERRIPRVVISCLDHSPQVSGRGVALLRDAGVEVQTGVLEAEGLELARPRQVYVSHQRPYIILKYARSPNGMFGLPGEEQVWLTNSFAKRLVHRWRAEVDAILVGTRTARIDDPALTTRYHPGDSPLRIVLDRRGALPPDLKLFDGRTPTLRITQPGVNPPLQPGVEHLPLPFDEDLLSALLRELHRREVGLLLVEGGSQVIRSFLDQELWDEARVLTGDQHLAPGLPAPTINRAPVASARLGSNRVDYYRC